jgi:hypothetical protein
MVNEKIMLTYMKIKFLQDVIRNKLEKSVPSGPLEVTNAFRRIHTGAVSSAAAWLIIIGLFSSRFI